MCRVLGFFLFVYLFLLVCGFVFLWFVGLVCLGFFCVVFVFLGGVGVLILIVSFDACKRKREIHSYWLFFFFSTFCVKDTTLLRL